MNFNICRELYQRAEQLMPLSGNAMTEISECRCIEMVRLTAKRLSSHDPDYETSLTTGVISQEMQIALNESFFLLWNILENLVVETMDRCELSTVSVKDASCLLVTNCSANSFAQQIFSDLAEKHPSIAAEFSHLRNVLDVDRWIKELAEIATDPTKAVLRREVGLASLTLTESHGVELCLKTEHGEMIPTFAPILIRGDITKSGESGSAYYLTLPNGR